MDFLYVSPVMRRRIGEIVFTKVIVDSSYFVSCHDNFMIQEHICEQHNLSLLKLYGHNIS